MRVVAQCARATRRQRCVCVYCCYCCCCFCGLRVRRELHRDRRRRCTAVGRGAPVRSRALARLVHGCCCLRAAPTQHTTQSSRLRVRAEQGGRAALSAHVRPIPARPRTWCVHTLERSDRDMSREDMRATSQQRGRQNGHGSSALFANKDAREQAHGRLHICISSVR